MAWLEVMTGTKDGTQIIFAIWLSGTKAAEFIGQQKQGFKKPIEFFEKDEVKNEEYLKYAGAYVKGHGLGDRKLDKYEKWEHEENLPMGIWRAGEAVDLLIACTKTKLKVYMNGHQIKSWAHFHGTALSTPPKLDTIIIREFQGVTTKLSWTYCK